MSTWFRKDLGNGADAFAPTREMQTAFMTSLVAHPEPRPQWAMFSRYDLAADNVEVYFTPAAAGLAAQFGATPCAKPVLNEFSMSLLCGEGDGLLNHFPDPPRNQR